MSKRILIVAMASGILTTTLLFGGNRGWKTINGIQYDASTGQPNCVQAKRFLHLDDCFDARDYGGINAAVTAIGSTPGTLVIHDPQVLTGNLAVPATLGIKILNGGTIVKASAYVPIFNGPFEAGDYQVFSGFSSNDFSSATFVAGMVKEINPKWWGANPTASAATNTTALNCAGAAMHWFCTYHLPSGTYLTNDAVAISALNGVTILLDGEIRNNVAGNGLTLTNINHSTVKVMYIDRIPAVRTGTDAAIKIVGPFVGSKLYYEYLSGFARAKYFYAPENGSIGYWDVYAGRDTDCVIHDYYHCIRVDDEWIGGGTVHGGSYSGGEQAVYFDYSSGGVYHHIKYEGTLFEGIDNGIDLTGVYGTGLLFPYFEAIAANEVDLRSATSVTWLNGYGDYSFQDLDVKMDSGSRNINVLGAGAFDGVSTVRGLFQDAATGGITWQNGHDVRGGANSRMHYYPVPIYNTWALVDANGVTQYANMQYLTNVADSPPTVGTYKAGAVAWNTARASGKTCFWTCKTDGTAGKLAGVMANTASGSNSIVVNNGTYLRYGQIVTVAGASDMTSRYISGISENSLTIALSGAPATDDSTGQAVSFVNPTWQAGPVYP